MNTTSSASTIVGNLAGWLFGLVALAIGAINAFWGNDPGFGVFIIALSLVFFPPINAFIKEKTGFAIPRILKWLLAFFIIWASVGVGELFDKVDLMLHSL